MTHLSPIQKRLFAKAKHRLKKEPWFKGVCVDEFPTDEDIRYNFEGALATVEMNTAYWDDPNFPR